MADPKSDFTTKIPDRIKENVEGAKTIGAIYLFKISGEGGGTWTLNLKDNPGVTEGDAGNSECTLELDAADWGTITSNPQAAMQLYFQGKLKVGGNPMLATKLQAILG